MKPRPVPEIGDIWIKYAYKTVGWPAGRVTITDIVKLANETRVHYNFLAGTQAKQPKRMELREFQRRFIHGRSPASATIPDPDQAALEFAEHREAYRGDDDI